MKLILEQFREKKSDKVKVDSDKKRIVILALYTTYSILLKKLRQMLCLRLRFTLPYLTQIKYNARYPKPLMQAKRGVQIVEP